MLFFRKEKPRPRKARVRPGELNEKYQDLLGDLLNEFESEASSIFNEINESKKEIAALLDGLKEASLKNEKIPPKEKHFMEGNRLSYIKAVNAFLSKLDDPESISDDTVKSFLIDYEESSEEFKAASSRPGQITMHFFGDMMNDINEQLKRISKCCGDLLALMKSDNIRLLSETKSKIQMLQKEIEKSEKISRELEQAELDYEELKKERAVFEQRINAIKKNSAFLQLSEVSSLVKRAEEELKIIDAEFIGNFLQIEKALKKFSKNDDDFINKYIEDPVSAVLNDPELKIVEILGKANEALKSGALEIEDKKKEKLVEKIASLTKEKFTKFIIDHNDRTLKINSLRTKIKQNNSQREIEDTRYKLEHVQKKQELAGENIKRLNNQIEGLKIAELKYDIEKAFESLNVPVEIEMHEEAGKEESKV